MNWLSKLLGIATLRDLEYEIKLRQSICESLKDMININHKLIGVNEELIDSNFDIIDELRDEVLRVLKKQKTKK